VHSNLHDIKFCGHYHTSLIRWVLNIPVTTICLLWVLCVVR